MEPEEVDWEFFDYHLTPYDRRYPDQLEAASDHMTSECPVTWSDAHGGYWVVSSYAGVRAVFQDWEHFSAAKEKTIPHVRPTQVDMPPFDVDPPVQRQYRSLLGPHLTADRAEALEPSVRRLVNDMIDRFIEDGEVELVSQMAREFPGRMFCELVINVDPKELPVVLGWMNLVTSEPESPAALEAEQSWNDWMFRLVARRREAPRCDDVIDGLLYGTVDGRMLTDAEAMGVVKILILGGLSTTTHALANAMYRLASRPDLQARLRNDHSAIPRAIEELLRFDPPASLLSRVCRSEASLGQHTIRPGDRVACVFVPANRDSAQFLEPERIDVDRVANRHLTFGVGVHRCIGSHLARLNLRVALEVLLERLGHFDLATDSQVRRAPKVGWGPDRLDLAFEPGPRIN